MQLKTAEWKQSALAGMKWSTKYGCIWCYGGEGTTSDIKITKDEAMSAHELNEICTFPHKKINWQLIHGKRDFTVN